MDKDMTNDAETKNLSEIEKCVRDGIRVSMAKLNPGALVKQEGECPCCLENIDDCLFEKPWFRETEVFMQAGTPDGPPEWRVGGMQECPHCNSRFYMEG